MWTKVVEEQFRLGLGLTVVTSSIVQKDSTTAKSFSHGCSRSHKHSYTEAKSKLDKASQNTSRNPHQEMTALLLRTLQVSSLLFYSKGRKGFVE